MGRMRARKSAAGAAILLGALGLGSVAAQAPAGDNLQVLTDAPGDELALIMNAVARSLGVDCAYCHVEGDFARDDKPQKVRARAMMRMVQEAATGPFELLDAPSCWTCHRGAPTPPEPPAAGSQILAPPAEFADPFSPAGGFRNLQRYAGYDGEQLRAVMERYNRDLGVGCAFCHPGADWAGDGEVRKLLSRTMLDAQRAMSEGYFEESDAITCWTCHQGARIPETTLPPALLSLP